MSNVKKLDAGVAIGYGGTYVTDKETIVATVPVGYADGYKRDLSSKGRVLVHGEYAPVIGRVCMDQFMVDVTDIAGVTKGDQVTLVGCNGDECITVEELSSLAHSFAYEFVCDVSYRVPRIYHNK